MTKTSEQTPKKRVAKTAAAKAISKYCSPNPTRVEGGFRGSIARFKNSNEFFEFLTGVALETAVELGGTRLTANGVMHRLYDHVHDLNNPRLVSPGCGPFVYGALTKIGVADPQKCWADYANGRVDLMLHAENVAAVAAAAAVAVTVTTGTAAVGAGVARLPVLSESDSEEEATIKAKKDPPVGNLKHRDLDSDYESDAKQAAK